MSDCEENVIEYISNNLPCETVNFGEDTSQSIYTLTDSNQNVLHLLNNVQVDNSYQHKNEQETLCDSYNVPSISKIVYTSAPEQQRTRIFVPIIPVEERDKLKKLLEEWKLEFLFEILIGAYIKFHLRFILKVFLLSF